MYLLLCHYKKPLEEVDKCLTAHRDYLNAKVESGELVVAGRRNPRSGGVLITTHKNLDDARAFAANDPFTIHDVADFEVIEWTPTVMGDLSLLK